MSAVQVAVKKIRIMGPNATEEVDAEDVPAFEQQIESTVSDINWSMFEQLVSDSLPEGYYCKIDDGV